MQNYAFFIKLVKKHVDISTISRPNALNYAQFCIHLQKNNNAPHYQVWHYGTIKHRKALQQTP